MAADGPEPAETALTNEEIGLCAELGEIIDKQMGELRRDFHNESEDAKSADRRVRAIVLRLTQIERERIELNVARGL